MVGPPWSSPSPARIPCAGRHCPLRRRPGMRPPEHPSARFIKNVGCTCMVLSRAGTPRKVPSSAGKPPGAGFGTAAWQEPGVRRSRRNAPVGKAALNASNRSRSLRSGVPGFLTERQGVLSQISRGAVFIAPRGSLCGSKPTVARREFQRVPGDFFCPPVLHGCRDRTRMPGPENTRAAPF